MSTENRPDAEAIHEKAVEMETAYANLHADQRDHYGRLAPQMEAEIDVAEAKFYDYLREHRDVLGEREDWASQYRNVERADISAKALEMQKQVGELYSSLQSGSRDDAPRVLEAIHAADGELERYLTDHQEQLRHWPAWRDHYARRDSLADDALEFNR